MYNPSKPLLFLIQNRQKIQNPSLDLPLITTKKYNTVISFFQNHKKKTAICKTPFFHKNPGKSFLIPNFWKIQTPQKASCPPFNRYLFLLVPLTFLWVGGCAAPNVCLPFSESSANLPSSNDLLTRSAKALIDKEVFNTKRFLPQLEEVELEGTMKSK